MTQAGSMATPIAHSARDHGQPDPYRRHVRGVVNRAMENVNAMMRFGPAELSWLPVTIEVASTVHDLGKLDPDNQAVLRRGRSGAMRWDHIDGGVAHASNCGDLMAAWLVRAHHTPGLPARIDHFSRAGAGWRLRGRRWTDGDEQGHRRQIERTDEYLADYLASHEAAVGSMVVHKRKARHGLAMRLALSCLVDADHSDTAFFDRGYIRSEPAEPRWDERLAALQAYVAGLGGGESALERERNLHRSAFFDACMTADIGASLVSCEAPVGLGKTTAVVAYLLRMCIRYGLRRLIVVAPYTNILNQTARRLRTALVLDGERPSDVIVEHHHRADFESEEARDLAVLWRAPIVLTTAVGLFETMAACSPSRLRKLHSLPGSAIFLDEAHASLPVRLWPQNWLWLRQLTSDWGCRVVMASGSLSRFWEEPAIVGEKAGPVPEIMPSSQAAVVHDAERRRVRYRKVAGGSPLSVDELVRRVRRASGPRLVILNTVQTAAVVARAMRESGARVLHLSTALTPRDRDRILRKVETRLCRGRRGWTLVATSCVEAGVDISFRRAFRERFSVASILQVGGRVNRSGEYGGGVVYDFELNGPGVTEHPEARVSAEILRRMMRDDALNTEAPSDLVSKALREEVRFLRGDVDPMVKAEEERDYPRVDALGRVIDADTRVVVVDPRIKRRLEQYKRVDSRALLRGSVQIWARKVEMLGLATAPGYGGEVYVWDAPYDAEFLGIMAGILQVRDFQGSGGGVV